MPAPAYRAVRRRARVALVACSAALAAPVALAAPSPLPPEVGYNYDEIETPRSAALNGASHASSNAIDGLFYNPANMAVTRVYHLAAFAQIWPEARRQSYGAAAVDSIESSVRLAGGIGGTWNLQDPDGIDRRSTDLRFAFALPFGDRFFLGVGGRYLWLKQDGFGPFGRSPASGGLGGADIVKGITFDAGATVRPVDSLSLSIVGQNLNNPDTTFQPTTFGGGVGVKAGDFGAEADVIGDFTSWGRTTVRTMGGLEYLVGDHVPLRLGYRYDEGASSHSVSGGLGYIDQAFAVELAVRRVVSGDAATAVVLGFTYHLESTGLTPSPADTF